MSSLIPARRLDLRDLTPARVSLPATGHSIATSEVLNFQLAHAQARDAVHAALSLPWSNGRVEGHINRLKCLKRQMYGRAKLDLLQQRLLAT